MEAKLTQAQLSQIVAEVAELSDRQQEELDAERVREILRELSLPPELLEEAMVQLRRREALKVQQKRRNRIIGGAVLAIALLIAGITFFSQQQNQTLSRIAVRQDKITLARNNGITVNSVSRQANPELFYQVTLKDAPVGQKVSLSCNWFDPNGNIVHQNQYQTKEITTSIWNTSCRHTITNDSPVGTWRVQMLQESRLLGEKTFNVR